jgi:uncharacterized membrane protein
LLGYSARRVNPAVRRESINSEGAKGADCITEPHFGRIRLLPRYIDLSQEPVSYSPVLVVHICAGTSGLLSGIAALSFRKGSPRHVLAGKVFVASMLIMAVGAIYLAVVRDQPNNIGGGIFTFYLIGTAWLTARRRDGETSRLDWLALLVPLALGILTWINGLKIVRNGAHSENGVPVEMMFFMGSVMLLAAAGDIRMLVGSGIFGRQRIARHLWRMCFGLFIAAGSFFMGPSNRPLRLLSAVGLGQHLPPVLFSTGLYLILTILPLTLMIFWLVRVRFTHAYKGRSRQLASASRGNALTGDDTPAARSSASVSG